jgi:hypothetical protein
LKNGNLGTFFSQKSFEIWAHIGFFPIPKRQNFLQKIIHRCSLQKHRNIEGKARSSWGQPLILRGHRLEGGTSKMKGHPQEQAFLLELKYTRTYKGKACSGGPPLIWFEGPSLKGRARVNQHPPVHDEGWMVSTLEIIFC